MLASRATGRARIRQVGEVFWGDDWDEAPIDVDCPADQLASLARHGGRGLDTPRPERAALVGPHQPDLRDAEPHARGRQALLRHRPGRGRGLRADLRPQRAAGARAAAARLRLRRGADRRAYPRQHRPLHGRGHQRGASRPRTRTLRWSRANSCCCRISWRRRTGAGTASSPAWCVQHNPPPVMLWLLRRLLRAAGAGRDGHPADTGAALRLRLRPAGLPRADDRPRAMEMHVLPQRHVFRAAAEAGCLVLEAFHDGRTSSRGLSYAFTFQRPGAPRSRRPRMTDLWRLSATDLAARIRARQVSATEVARDALARLDAVNPRINAVVDHRPEEVLAAGRRDRRRARARRGSRPARRRAGHHQGQRRPGGLRHHQRPAPAEGPGGAAGQSGGRQPAPRRRGAARPHQHAGLLAALVHAQFAARAHAQPARSVDHAGRLLGRRGGGGHGGHRRHRAWHGYRRVDALPGLCLRRARAAPDARAHPGVERLGRGTPHRRAADGGQRADRAHHRRCAAWPSPRCARATSATRGGSARRWRARPRRSAPRCA